MSVLNTRAQGLARHARAGKDGAFYNERGDMLATVESFTVQTSFNNAQFSVLGNPLELETLNTHKHTLTFTQVVVMDDRYVEGLMNFFKNGTAPNWTFQGALVGNNGSQERMVYKNCIPSGQIDLQNVTVGDTSKRNWSFTINSEPALQKKLTI